MTHAFRFASVSKQLICRDLYLFQIESHIFKIKFQTNPDLLNRIFTVQIESPKVLESRFKSMLLASRR